MLVGPAEERVSPEGKVRVVLRAETFSAPNDTRELALALQAVWVSESPEDSGGVVGSR